MKQLDWKSFAIGVLLTTTVILGTGTTKRFAWTEDWSRDMKWAVMWTRGMPDESTTVRLGEGGYFPFDAEASINPKDTVILWRKRTF